MSRFNYYSIAAGIGMFAFVADQLLVRSKRMDLDYAQFTQETISAAADEAKDYYKAEDEKHNITPTSLQKHVLAFGKLDSKTNTVRFDAFTTAFTLRNMGEPLWPVIGFFVALGSKLQAGKCPFGSAAFDTQKGIHLGTSRLWNKDGHFDETRWNDLLKKINPQDDFISQSAWYKAVAEFTSSDLPEENTNRNVGTDFIHRQKTQIDTAKREAKEMFKLLGTKHDNDIVMPTWLVESYFKDTRVALRAVNALKLKASESVVSASVSEVRT